MGHIFGEEMVCVCGTDWDAHQSEPKVCAQVRSRYNLQPLNGSSPLDALRRGLGISVLSVANSCGVSPETARRALSGQVGGRGGTAVATADRVSEFVHDVARGTGGDG